MSLRLASGSLEVDAAGPASINTLAALRWKSPPAASTNAGSTAIDVESRVRGSATPHPLAVFSQNTE